MDIDSYILAHHKSMSCREMADKLETTKSTISRHMKALRESGELEDSKLEAARAASERARAAVETAEGFGRLVALRELRDMLHDELGQSGGASMARVASEYRKTLEEVEALEHEQSLVEQHGRIIEAEQLSEIRTVIDEKLEADVTAQDILDAVIGELHERGFVKCGLLTVLQSKTHYRGQWLH